jgi:DNA (cytosine-5)-methyltransferase 1
MEVRAHVDNWEPAIRTVNANFGEDCVPVDVASLTVPDVIELAGGKAPRVMVGGPPCQSFTSAGRRRVDDPRGSLVGMYASLAAAVRPDVVVFENVEGFVTAGGGRFVFDLLDPLIEAGYRVRLRKVNLANYGVPQHRKRVIAVASLLDEPPFPLPSHSAWGAPGAKAVAGRPPTPTLGEALAGLPEPDSPDAPTDHVVSKVGALEQARISALKPGQTMRDLPEELWHESYRRRAYRRVMDGVPTERRGGAPAGLRRLRADEPSKAVTSAAVREFIHPTQDRRLTLREVARLQTFPDHFEFIGTFSERATLVGNAVPPRFAAALGGAIREHVNAGQSETRQESREGALVEFDVTPGQQMSPALARVVSDVNARYIACSLFASLESA